MRVPRNSRAFRTRPRRPTPKFAKPHGRRTRLSRTHPSADHGSRPSRRRAVCEPVVRFSEFPSPSTPTTLPLQNRVSPARVNCRPTKITVFPRNTPSCNKSSRSMRARKIAHILFRIDSVLGHLTRSPSEVQPSRRWHTRLNRNGLRVYPRFSWRFYRRTTFRADDLHGMYSREINTFGGKCCASKPVDDDLRRSSRSFDNPSVSAVIRKLIILLGRHIFYISQCLFCFFFLNARKVMIFRARAMKV